jgi:hypothetical protein
MKFFLNLIFVITFLGVYSVRADDSISVENDICSGGRTTLESETLTLKCEGKFTLSDGTITTEKKLIIVSGSSIVLENILIFANEIEVRSPVGITIGSHALLSATGTINYIVAESGDQTVMGPGIIIKGGDVVSNGNSFTIAPRNTISIEGSISNPSDGVSIVGSSNTVATVSVSETSEQTPSRQENSSSGLGSIDLFNIISLLLYISVSLFGVIFKRFYAVEAIPTNRSSSHTLCAGQF